MIRSSTVAVEQPQLPELLSIYPNPSHGEVHLDSRAAGEIWLIQIDGKVINKSDITRGINYRDWTALSEGLYLIRFVGRGYSETKRLVIVK